MCPVGSPHICPGAASVLSIRTAHTKNLGLRGAKAVHTCDVLLCCQSDKSITKCRQYSKEYIALEESAHAEQRGIWGGSFQVPAEWRREHKRGNAAGQPPTSKPSSFTPGKFLIACRRKCLQCWLHIVFLLIYTARVSCHFFL